MRVLSVSEQKRLISVLFDNIDNYKLGVFICLYTGIRIGELCALQWKNISFSEKTLKVEHTMQRLQCEDPNALYKTRIIVTEPKSNTALRTIPLPDFVLETMKPFVGSPDTYVLSNERKSIIEPRTMQAICRVISVICGLVTGLAARSFLAGTLAALAASISSALIWLWTKFYMLFLMWSMQQNEFVADEYAYNLGYGAILASVLDKHMCSAPANGLLKALYSAHPRSDDRVARLQYLGADYSRY